MKDTPEQSIESTDAVIIPLSARTETQLKQRASDLLAYLDSTSPNLTAVAYTLQTGREAMEERLGFIVNSVSELKETLSAFCTGTVNIENCYQGHVKDNKEVLGLFSNNEELQEAVGKWILRKKLPDILKVWVKGLNVDWSKLYGTTPPERLSLPTYTFANERYWFTDAKPPYFTGNPQAHKTFPENDISASSEAELIRKKILDRLKRLLGEVIELPVSKIKEDDEFEVYGIDSIAISQLNQKLTYVFEKISKTLFFEYKTLNALADYFLKEHPQKCFKWAGLLKKERINRASKNAETRTKRSSLPYEMSGTAIAIIGISGIYPQAETQEDFWNNLKTGKDCITEIPQDRWSLEGFYHPNVQEAIKQGLSYSKWGGFIEQFAEFDPLFFNISPKDALNIDPQERLFLQTSWKALENAGYTRQILEEVYQQRIGVFVGITRTGFDLYRGELWDKQLNPRTSFGSVANRLSYFLNVQGPSMPIDTMCSSSLTAIHEACEHIHRGECELAIAGGVNLYLHPSDYIGLCGQRMLSEDGQCKSFGIGGNGFVPGEGVGVVILKRLSAAINDQDCIHAVIRATNVNHGGKTNGYTVPNPVAQAALIRETLDKAGINARRISYIEAHETGTELGDPIEMTGLCQAFEQDTQDVQFCKIGSVKSNIGHLEAAAGIAGLTKVILQMKQGQIAPSLHSETLNPNIDFDETPFIVNQELTPWQRSNIQGKEVPLIAGISSFGAGGSNAHILVEEYIETSQTERDSTEPAIILLSARHKNQLDQMARNLLEFLRSSSPNLQSLAYTLQVGREAMEVRLGMIVESIEALKTILGNYLSGQNDEYYLGKIKDNRDALAIFAMDEDLSDAIESWISKRKLTALLELWVKGLTSIDWSRLYGEVKPRRICLPTYPFAKNRYWFKGTNAKNGTLNTGVEVSRLHPLLHTNTSDLSEQRFTSVFTGNEFFFNDHKVKGEKVLPGVAYLEMVRAAVERSVPASKEQKSIRLGNVVWLQPISINESAKEIHVALFADNTEIQYEVYTKSEKPIVHSQGFIELEQEEAAYSINIEDIKNQMQQGTLNSAQCYQAFKQMGLNYGTGFQGIREIYKGDNQILAVLSLPSSVQETQSDYVLHPSMMDSAFQSIIGLNPTDNDASKPYLPFSLESLEIRGACTSVMYAWLRCHNGMLNDMLKLDMTLCDEQGNVSVILKGITFKSLEGEPQTSPASQVNDDIGHLLATPVWKEAPISIQNTYPERRIVLCEFRDIEPDKLESQISGSTCIALESKKDKIDARFTDYATDCFQDIRQILKNKRQDSLLYQVIIPSSQEHTVFAGLSGLLRTASLENPKVIGQIITIDPQDSIENLAKKIQENDHGHYIKYENEKRFIRVWEEQPVIPQDHEFRFKNRGIYLITGGLGGLGLIFAREILQQTKQATLILTGRSELSAEKQKILDELHQEIKPDNRHIIKYYKTDVSRSEQVRLLIESIQGDYGKLDGIIHSAGIIQDNFIYKKTTDEFKNVLASKVSGAINLDIATQNTALDFFVLFSSIAALGNIGQADYATANAFMDQFAHYRNELVTKNQRQGQTLSINWPFWEDGGMRVDEASKAMMKKLAGVLPMRTETGVKILMHALSSSDSQVLVIEGFLTRVRDFLFDQSDIEKRQITSSRRELNTLRSEIETMLLQLMSTTLKLNPQDIEEIDPDAEFNEYGFDSITLTDFANQINHTCSLNLVPTIFFEFPTLSRLTDYLQNEFGTNFEELFQTKGTRLKQPEIKNQVFVRPRTRCRVCGSAPRTYRYNRNEWLFPRCRGFRTILGQFESGKRLYFRKTERPLGLARNLWQSSPRSQ